MIALKISRRGWFGRTQRRALPSSWDEVPQARLLFCLRHLFALEREVAMPLILADLLRIPVRSLRHFDRDDLAALFYHLEWMKLEAVPVPVIRSFTHKGITYHLPADKFSNGVCMEYPLADEFYGKYLEADKEDKSALLKLTATLCREAKTDEAEIQRTGDIRIPLNSRPELEARAMRLEGLPLEYQIAVLLYFAGVKALIHKVYGKVLFDNDEESEADKPARKKSGTLFGWWGVYMDLAGDITKLDKVHQTNFHTTCMYLVKRRREQQEAEMQMRLQSKSFGK